MKGKKAAADDIGRETRLALYRMQLELRYCEKRAYDLFLQNLIKGTSHLSLGQEAVAAGFGVAMRPDDWTFCTYRGHAHTLARGASMAGVLGELMGRECGLLGGKGGSMHLTDVAKGAMGSYAIIGAHLPVAAGAAWMVWQVKTGAWNAPDPAEAISRITETAGGAIGIITAVLLVAFFVHKRRGN